MSAVGTDDHGVDPLIYDHRGMRPGAISASQEHSLIMIIFVQSFQVSRFEPPIDLEATKVPLGVGLTELDS